MQSKAATVSEYIASLPDDRRAAIAAVRKVILANLGEGFAEGMQYGMIGYNIPHSVYPPGYHCDPRQPLPFAGLASQKGYMSLYLFCAYTSPEHERWFRQAWAAAGKKLDMGKSCIRFKKLDDVPLDVIGDAIRRVSVQDMIGMYESALGGSVAKKKPPAKKTPGAKKEPAVKKQAAKKKTRSAASAR